MQLIQTFYPVILDSIATFVALLYGLDIVFLFLFGLHTYLMIFLYRRSRSRFTHLDRTFPPLDPDKDDPEKFPLVAIQLPIYNEYYVIDRLLEGVAEMKWPREKLEIQVLDDSTDNTVEKVKSLVDEMKRDGFQIEHIHRTDRRGHKAGALRSGLEKTDAEYVAVFDADFIPAPNFLLRTVPYFASEEIGMVQTRWGHINGEYSPLTQAQTLGIDGHFLIEQAARNGNDLWMNFNGTGGIWRKKCIIEAGNWSGDTLTEDFDLSYRAELIGWKFRYLSDVINPAELPATIAAYRSQQFRWCKGSIQTAVKLLPRILKSDFSWKIKGEAFVHLVNYTVHPLMVINILLTLPLLILENRIPFGNEYFHGHIFFALATFLSLGTFGPIFFYIYSQRVLYTDWLRKVRWLPGLMVIGTGIAASNTRAWLEALMGVKSVFQRTPKYRIEKKTDKVAERDMYLQPIDPIVFVEFFMGIYCLAIVYAGVIYERYLVIPFMMLYMTGFFYISVKSLLERGTRVKSRSVEKQLATAESSAEAV